MAEVTYYFNAYVTPVWTNPDNLIDGDTGTFASTGSKSTAQTLTGNTCPADDLGAITKVELRVFAYGDGDDRIDITPVFTGGNGDAHETVPVVSPGDWTAYVDITKDTNAEDWAEWSDVQNLDCIIDNVPVAKANPMYCSKVEIRVTYWVKPVADIDIGSIPKDRTATLLQGATIIAKDNPANASGTLHSIKTWAYENIAGLRVGTFYLTNGNTLKCRDSAVIGDVTAGSEQTFTGLSITVVEGDYIGCYFTDGRIEADTTGFAGRWSVSGEHIDPNDEAEYTFYAGYALSLYGYGDIAAAPTVTTQAVADIEPTTATGHGTITDIGVENPSKRGVCWNTIGNPTVADDKSEETDSFGTGAFSRPMTGLIPETHYYVKAYAYNSAGYGYGDEVEFDAAWEPPVADIDVGAAPIDRTTTWASGHTIVDKNNPANAGGVLHSIKVHAYANITGLIVGTFYTTDGNTLKCRDSELVGDVVAGAIRTFTELSITVEEGDYIGGYFTDGYIDRDLTGFAGMWWVVGEYIDPSDETTYTFSDGDAVSLYGYGDIEAPPEVELENKSANMGSKMIAAGLI